MTSALSRAAATCLHRCRSQGQPFSNAHRSTAKPLAPAAASHKFAGPMGTRPGAPIAAAPSYDRHVRPRRTCTHSMGSRSAWPTAELSSVCQVAGARRSGARRPSPRATMLPRPLQDLQVAGTRRSCTCLLIPRAALMPHPLPRCQQTNCPRCHADCCAVEVAFSCMNFSTATSPWKAALLTNPYRCFNMRSGYAFCTSQKGC